MQHTLTPKKDSSLYIKVPKFKEVQGLAPVSASIKRPVNVLTINYVACLPTLEQMSGWKFARIRLSNAHWS